MEKRNAMLLQALFDDRQFAFFSLIQQQVQAAVRSPPRRIAAANRMVQSSVQTGLILKGIRDPHIFRGPDGAFYLSMTDLHIYAQKDGFRDTEWERDGKEYGWGNNRGLVLMKSWDLINWKRTNARFDLLSAGLGEIGCVWAPEVTYDDKKGKLMIYFTMRFKNEANKLYYVYVNDDFDRIETLPQILFEYPNEKISAIDGDITKVGDRYRMFYVSHDGGAGIKPYQTASTVITNMTLAGTTSNPGPAKLPTSGSVSAKTNGY